MVLRRTGSAVAILLAASALLFFPSLFTRDPWNPDEPRATEVAREMVALGDCLVPHLNGEPYSDKPPVFYWLASVFWRSGFGLNSGRMVSVLAATGTALLVYALGRRLHSPETGLLAALITLTTLLFGFICKFGVLDPLLTFFTTAAIVCAVRAFEGGARHGRWWLAAYAMAALAVLTKGPPGLAVAVLVPLAYGYARRHEVRKGGWWHVAGAALCLTLVAAWVVPACLRAGAAYTQDLLFQQTAQRMGEEASHWQPFYFYFLYAPVFLLPWTLLFVPGLLWGVRVGRTRRDAVGLLAAAWFLSVLVFFSLFSGKRERYLLPLVPAVGLLCARYIAAVIRGELVALGGHRGLWKVTFVLVGLLGIFFVAAALEPNATVMRLTADGDVRAEMRAALTPGVRLGAGFGGALILAACLWGLQARRDGRGEGRRAAAAVAAMLTLSLTVDLVATPVINRFKSGRDLVEEAGPYLREPYEIIFYQSDYSGVYNLFTRRIGIRLIKDEKGGPSAEEQLREALRAGTPLSLIAKEGREVQVEGMIEKFGLRQVAHERVGHRRMFVLTNAKP